MRKYEIIQVFSPQASVGDQELSVDDGVDPTRDAGEEEEAAPAERVVGDGAVGLDVLQVAHRLDPVARLRRRNHSFVW